MNKRDKIILQKILQYCDDIEKLEYRFGNEYESYETDFAYQYAASMCIIQIGELTAQLSDEFKNNFSNVPWRLIKDMRNLFAHDYARVDNEIVWNTLQSNIPELEKECEKIIEELNEK